MVEPLGEGWGKEDIGRKKRREGERRKGEGGY